MVTLLETPASLCGKARKATSENRDVMLDPGVVRSIAEMWHVDKEKIRYLESLIVRIGRDPVVRNGEVPTPPIDFVNVTIKNTASAEDIARLLRRPNPADGAPKPSGHNPVA